MTDRDIPGREAEGSLTDRETPGRKAEEVSRIGFLGLGSNVGDREEHLRAALGLLPEHGVTVLAVSSLYETEPVGEILDQPDFLNAAVRIETGLEPEALLDACKAIEVEQGRMFGGPRHGPRPLDVDVLLLGDVELAGDRLTLPHPQVTARRFVLEPLLELDPELALPDGTALQAALAELGEGERAERVSPPPPATRAAGPAASVPGSPGPGAG